MGPGVGDRVADADDDAGVPDRVGVVTGAELVADPQATTRRAATIVAATSVCDERTRCLRTRYPDCAAA